MKALGGRSALVGAALATGLLVAATPPASARWSVHDGSLVTEAQPPPGATEDEVCRDQVRGRTGFAESVSEGDDPAGFLVPDHAFSPVTYEVYQAPPGVSLHTDSPDGVQTVVGYSDQAGVFHPATLLTTFTTAPRTRLPAPLPSGVGPGHYVFTAASFAVPVPQAQTAVQPGDTVGLKPWPGFDGSTVLDLTAVDCGDPGFLSGWEGDPVLCGPAGRAVAGDVNGDGRGDVVCQTPSSGALSVGLARAGGQLAQVDWQGTLGFCGSTSRLLIGDVNGDGRSDLVCHTPSTGNDAVALARTGGRFPAVDWRGAPGPCPAPGGRVLLGDVTGDFRSDLVCQNPRTGAVSVARARATGRFPAVDTRDTPAFCTTTGTRLLLGDVTGDFRSDLVCHDPATGGVSVARARAGGRFPALDTRSAPRICRQAGGQVRLADVTGDSRSDLVCHDPATGHVWLALARAGGSFPSTDWSRNMGLCTGTPAGLLPADVDADGRADLVCQDPATGHVRVAYSDR